jgi:hypothetical protein
VLVGDAPDKIITALGGNDMLRGDAVSRAQTGRAGHAFSQADNLDQKRPGGDARSTGDAAIAARSTSHSPAPRVFLPRRRQCAYCKFRAQRDLGESGPGVQPCSRALNPWAHHSAISKRCSPCNFKKRSLLLSLQIPKCSLLP